MTTHRAHVDWQRLGEDLDAVCARRLISIRRAAAEIGIPSSGLTKLRHGGKLSADGVARLVAWLYPHARPHWIIPATGDQETSEETTR